MLRPEYPIRTQRLALRPYRPSDLDYLADVMSRPDVMRYLYDEPRSRHQAAEVLDRRVRERTIESQGDILHLAVEVEGAVVGDVLLSYVSSRHRQGEIGWVFHPDHHGHGYATEASRAMLRLGFEGLGLHRIVARCDARNTTSIRVMERLGMRREAHFKQNEFVKGEWTDEFVYALLASEWNSR